jgi:hypothetical protein
MMMPLTSVQKTWSGLSCPLCRSEFERVLAMGNSRRRSSFSHGPSAGLALWWTVITLATARLCCRRGLPSAVVTGYCCCDPGARLEYRRLVALVTAIAFLKTGLVAEFVSRLINLPSWGFEPDHVLQSSRRQLFLMMSCCCAEGSRMNVLKGVRLS